MIVYGDLEVERKVYQRCRLVRRGSTGLSEW